MRRQRRACSADCGASRRRTDRSSQHIADVHIGREPNAVGKSHYCAESDCNADAIDGVRRAGNRHALRREL